MIVITAILFIMKAKELMTPVSKIFMVDEQMSLEEVSRLMLETHTSSILILKKSEKATSTTTTEQTDGKLLGIITQTDIVKAYLNGGNAAGKTEISEFTSKGVVVGDEEFSDEQIAKLMVDNKMHHLLIHNAKKNIVGIVSCFDLAKEVETSKHSSHFFNKLFTTASHHHHEHHKHDKEQKNHYEELLPGDMFIYPKP